MNVIIFHYEHIVGGAQTLSLRIFRVARKKSYNCYWVKTRSGKEDKYFINEINKIGVKILRLAPRKLSRNFCISNSILSFDEETTVITYDILEYFLSRKILKAKSGNNINYRLYIIHPYIIYQNSTNLFKKIVFYMKYQILYNRILRRIENDLYFMDFYCAYIARKYHRIRLNLDNIIKLGVEIDRIEEKVIMNRYHNKYFTILTISRIDFPFKYYLLPLIEIIAKKSIMNKNIRLIIIGDGKDKGLIENLINSKGLNKNISMISMCEYDKLNNYINISNLNIGMGTTILDAGKYGLPSLVAIPYCKAPLTIGLFSKENDSLGEPYDNEMIYKNMEIEIDRIMSMNENEYFAISIETYNHIRKEYNEDININRLIHNSNNNIGASRIRVEKRNLYALYIIQSIDILRDHFSKKRKIKII